MVNNKKEKKKWKLFERGENNIFIVYVKRRRRKNYNQTINY